MAGTDGNWLLPDSVRARLARYWGRYGETRLTTSLLPVAGTVSVQAVGLHPVGEVMGCVVQTLGWSTGPNYQADRYRGGADFGLYADALQQGYDTALARMTTEAKGMDADGVIGVRLTRVHRQETGHEFVALGTAVRADTTHRPRNVFTTDLPGQDVAKLMLAGWVPARIAIGIAVESQFLNDQTWAQMMPYAAGNTEVDAITRLVTRARDRSRQSFTRHARDAGADGAIVASMGLRQWLQKIGNVEVLCVEATVFGTTVARFLEDRPAPAKALTIMPLGQRAAAVKETEWMELR